MWTRLAGLALKGLALLLAGNAALAQSANEGAPGLESCFEAARLADAVCTKLSDNPEERVDCFAKARSSQLECLNRVLSELPAGTKLPEKSSEAARSSAPANQAAPEPPSARNTPNNPAESVGSVSPGQALERPDSVPTPAPQPSNKLSSRADEPREAPDKKDDQPVRNPEWLLSETTSPIDYSPLLTAVVRPTSDVKTGPNALAIRCRGKNTDVSLRTNAAWEAVRGGVVRVEYQLDERPMVRQQWALSADGKTATYKDDAVAFLQSIPEGATLKVTIGDKDNNRTEATFRLAGFSAVRQKVAAACKWAPVTAKTSTEAR
jgi:hypothetical protein